MFGKVLGAMIGAAVGLLLMSGPLALALGAIGALIGHLLFDRNEVLPPEKARSIDELLGQSAPAAPSAVPRSNPDAVLARLLCPLFIEVARSDAPVSQTEVRVIRQYFTQERRFGEE